MTDQETPTPDEQRVIDAFADFRAEHRAGFQPPPVEQVYAAARRQQLASRYRTAVAAAAALFLVLGTGALLNLVGSDQPHPSSGLRATASEAPSPSPPVSLSPKPPPSDHPTGHTMKPPMGSGAGDVLNATIAMPALGGCVGGVLEFSRGAATDSGGCSWTLSAEYLVREDVNGAAGAEAVTVVTASHTSAVVAIRGTKASDLKAMGYVVIPATDEHISSISVAPDESITVGITSAGSGEEQRRTYRWAASAKAFVQVGGPTGVPEPGPSGSESPSPAPSGGGQPS